MLTGLHGAKPYGTESRRWAEHCIQIGRVSAAEYFQGSFGQKVPQSAIEPYWLSDLSELAPASDRRPPPLIHGLKTVSLQEHNAAVRRPATQHVGATILRHRGFESGGDSHVSPSPLRTLHCHPGRKKSRLRAFSLKPISEPLDAKNGLEPARPPT